ncbi:thiamine pyrophosphate-dependent enzyme, partial [Magnetococcales bacterium HHB-1]
AESDMMVTPDFVKLADAYGAKGMRATHPNEVESTLQKGLESEGAVIMDFAVNREANVYPMVPAGAALDEMILA